MRCHQPPFPRPDVVAAERYERLRRLGGGGMGTVDLARDRRTGKLVALKVLDTTDCSILTRFRQEARLTARLESPSIVKILGMGELSGHPYIAMEYIDGQNLADAELDVRELVRCLRRVAEALRHAHANGVVHRDIKPENILLDRSGRTFVTDFGLARDLLTGADCSVSVEGQITGTPWCMPPEQALGELRAIDARSDVYSLGATLFYKLAGQRPFTGASVVDVLHAVIHAPPPSLRALRPDVPRVLERIALKCLQKDPGERYQTMDELCEEFDRFLTGTVAGPRLPMWFSWLLGG